MKLATRLSAFFLAALGLVLAGFATALFATAWAYLNRQVDDRLTSALAVLAAATEVHPEGVEWEPDERDLTLGRLPGPDRLRWIVSDDEGRRVDRSSNLVVGDEAPSWSPRPEEPSARWRVVDREGRRWRVAQRPVRAADPPVDASSVRDPNRAVDRSAKLYPALLLSVAAPLDPVDRTLASLGWFLAGLTLSVWSLAAVLGRWLVRRALMPLRRMVDSARGLDATDSGWSIPESRTGDEIDELGRAFNELLGRLRVAYERQRRFSGDASHQLRTPLTALIGQLDVALRRDRPADEYRRVLGLLRNQAGNLARVVEAMLFLGRAEAEAGLPDSVDLDLDGWAAEHAAAHPLATRIVLDRGESASGPIMVRANPALLGQLVDNLIDNADKYGEPGAPIVVEVRDGPRSPTLAVEDAGPGIDPADLPRLFEPFYRATRARLLGRPGIGLGLAVVQRIADALGGSVHVESQPGLGSRFVLSLPGIRADKPSAGPAPESIEIAETLGRSPGEKR